MTQYNEADTGWANYFSQKEPGNGFFLIRISKKFNGNNIPDFLEAKSGMYRKIWAEAGCRGLNFKEQEPESEYFVYEAAPVMDGVPDLEMHN